MARTPPLVVLRSSRSRGKRTRLLLTGLSNEIPGLKPIGTSRNSCGSVIVGFVVALRRYRERNVPIGCPC